MSTPTTNTEMTLEQLISIFGEATAKTMYEQMTASTATGGAPFPFLKKISTHGSELGAFGEYVHSVKTEKDAEGNKVVTDKGVNVGKDFQFLMTFVTYGYSMWNESTQKSARSNMFNDLSGIKTAVDTYTGLALPASKEDKKTAGWKLNKVMGGMVRADAKSEWTPVIFEVSGMLYYTYGELTNNKPNHGLLSGVADIVTKLESKGSTQYSVIDVKASSFLPNPADLFTNEVTRTMLKDITEGMSDHVKNNQYSGAQSSNASSNASSDNGEAKEDDTW